MGCDIHLYVERREGPDAPWVTADRWQEDEYEPGRMVVAYRDQFYSDRNYNLFAMLADVRNGRGFAGVRTGAGFVPMSAPRGVPTDACPEYRAEVERWDADGHSHSHQTVAELMAYDWTQTTQLCGWVDPLNWAQWRRDGVRRGPPGSWVGDVAGGAVRHLEEAEFEAAWQRLCAAQGWDGVRHWPSGWLGLQGDRRVLLDDFVSQLGGGSPYCHVTWEVSYCDSAEQFLGRTLPRLWRLGSPENVRIVYFFDN